MTWNHRIIKKASEQETSYHIHEVYYDEQGKIESWTAKAMEPWGESISELRNDILHFWSAFRLPILTETIDADGKESIVEDNETQDLNPGHFFEVMDRASVAMSHFDDFVGSHPVVQRDEKLKHRVGEITGSMYELYRELALKAIPEPKE